MLRTRRGGAVTTPLPHVKGSLGVWSVSGSKPVGIFEPGGSDGVCFPSPVAY